MSALLAVCYAVRYSAYACAHGVAQLQVFFEAAAAAAELARTQVTVQLAVVAVDLMVALEVVH